MTLVLLSGRPGAGKTAFSSWLAAQRGFVHVETDAEWSKWGPLVCVQSPLYAGTRIAEIRALDVADVRLSARKGELHLVGKGEKSRTVPVHPKLREALAAWLAERPAHRGADPAALFTSSRGTRMTTDAIADVIGAITAAAGLDDHVTSHVLRHTFGTELTRDGVDIVTVAELMGYASLETMRLYTRPSAADLQRAVDLLSADS